MTNTQNDFSKKDFIKEIKMIKQIQINDDQTLFRQLVKEYKPLIKSLSQLVYDIYKNIPLTRDDIESLCIHQMYENIKKFDEGQGKSFANYNKEYMRYRVLNELRVHTNNRNRVMNTYTQYEDYHESIDGLTVESFLENNEKYKYIELMFKISPEEIGNLEYDMLQLLLKGEKMNKISKKLNISRPTAYSIKEKLFFRLRKIVET